MLAERVRICLIPAVMHTSDPMPIAPVPWARVLAVMAAALIAAHLLDGLAWQHLRDPRVNDREWGRLLRSVGYVPTWLFGAWALWLAGRPEPDAPPNGLGWRATALLLTPALAGGVAELVKLAVRRQRPGAESAEYLFRPYSVDLWSTKGLGLASSHAAVAFGAAFVLARCFPATRWVWYTLAAGCALTRVMAGAHYVSDTVAAAALAWLTTEVVWRWAAKRKRRVSAGEHSPLVAS
jgi:membrane-associated phospholipid phosphatase